MNVPKYPKVNRLPIGLQGSIGRNVMDEGTMQKLLSGSVEVEEKLDGTTVGTTVIPGYVIYGEYLRYRHSVNYDRLPAWIVGFDALDLRSGRMLERDEKVKLFEDVGLPCAPLIFKGTIRNAQELVGFLERKSEFSTVEKVEGVVIKNYGAQLFGKVVRYEFITGIEKHWRKQRVILNKLQPNPTASPLAMSTELWWRA